MEVLNPDVNLVSACWNESDTEISFLQKWEEPLEDQKLLSNVTYYEEDIVQNEAITGGNAGQEDYLQNTNDKDVLKKAQKLWKKIVKGNYHYNAPNTEKIPITGKYIDCSSYVSWVLYEMGYKEFKGNQHRTKKFMSKNWNKIYGWTEIKVKAGENIVKKLKPGDIVVRTNVSKNGKIGYGHVSIVAKIKNGKVYSYDCGNEGYWRNSKGGPVEVTWFMKSDNRPGKIIRLAT